MRSSRSQKWELLVKHCKWLNYACDKQCDWRYQCELSEVEINAYYDLLAPKVYQCNSVLFLFWYIFPTFSKLQSHDSLRKDRMRQQKVSADAVDEEVITVFSTKNQTNQRVECEAPDAWLRELLSPEAT